jgi:hypothetical protein
MCLVDHRRHRRRFPQAKFIEVWLCVSGQLEWVLWDRVNRPTVHPIRYWAVLYSTGLVFYLVCKYIWENLKSCDILIRFSVEDE